MNSANGHDSHVTSARKAKTKKAIDAADTTSRLLEAKINQLEREAASDKDQEAEIEREVKRANRDLTQHISKMDDMQKIEHLLRRASELLADMRRLERENQRNKKRGDNLQKDKESKITELGKTTQLKEKLEKLCRELQKDNNKFKNENKTLNDTLTRNTKAHDQKMENVLNILDGYQKEKDNPRHEIIDVSIEELFQHRFKTLIEQYELRDLHFQAQLRTKELEVQYNIARYEQQKKIAEDETAKNRTLISQVQNLSASDQELRSQVNRYAEKFKQVEDTLTNSNELFSTFRKEIEDMSKRNRALERQNKDLKRIQRVSHESMLQMAAEREDWRARNAVPGSAMANSISKQDSDAHTREQSNGLNNGNGEQHSSLDEHGGNSSFDDSDEQYHTSDAESEAGDYTKIRSPLHSAQGSTERPTYGPERPPAPTSMSQTAVPGSSKA